MITHLDLKQALDAYTKAVGDSFKELQVLAEEAEETDDYYDYDQSSYDHNEFAAECGESLAAIVAEYLQDEWSVK